MQQTGKECSLCKAPLYFPYLVYRNGKWILRTKEEVLAEGGHPVKDL